MNKGLNLTLKLTIVALFSNSCLFSALSSNSYHLRKLHLTYNHFGEAQVKHLSAKLVDAHCQLDNLRHRDANCSHSPVQQVDMRM